MDVMLIIIWISIFLGWFLYRKFKKAHDEFDSLGMRYEGAFKSYKDFVNIFLMRENFIYAIMDQYNRFKGQP